MLSVGQNPWDWSGNYLMKIDLDGELDEKSRIMALLQYMDKQGVHVNNYKEYTAE